MKANTADRETKRVYSFLEDDYISLVSPDDDGNGKQMHDDTELQKMYYESINLMVERPRPRLAYQ